jgi:predicted DCC family thiol-disulfide oxidoreductase YuxK
MNAKAQLTSRPPVVLFDGVCNLCNGAVNFLIDRDPSARLRFASLQSAAARRVLAEAGWRGDTTALDSMLLVDGGRVYERSSAVLRSLRYVSAPWRAVAAVEWLLPRPLRDGVYRWVAARRYTWFGRTEQCRVPTPALRARFLEE